MTRRTKKSKVLRVALPLKPVYYFEQTDRSNRLFYYIPAATLRRMIQIHRVKDSILVDYPDGVEIEVSEIQFIQFEEHYNFFNEFQPASLRRAFEVLLELSRDGEVFRGCAYIDPANLEPLAVTVDRILQGLPSTQSTMPRDAQDVADDAQRELRRRHDLRNKRTVMQVVREHVPQNSNVPIRRQPWSFVKVSKGVNPLELFVRAQQEGRAEGHGN